MQILCRRNEQIWTQGPRISHHSGPLINNLSKKLWLIWHLFFFLSEYFKRSQSKFFSLSKSLLLKIHYLAPWNGLVITFFKIIFALRSTFQVLTLAGLNLSVPGVDHGTKCKRMGEIMTDQTRIQTKAHWISSHRTRPYESQGLNSDLIHVFSHSHLILRSG